MPTIYLDNAATSFPKPPQVAEAMVRFMEQVGANPGRSGHPMAVAADRIVQDTRENLARLFHIADASRISFALNVTEALNTVIYGFLKPGDHVVTTAMEHNAVVRPLFHLQRQGVIRLDIAPCDHRGLLDVDALAGLLAPRTALVVVNHASNVCGTLQDVAAVKGVIGDIPLLVDCAQTAGAHPIDVQAMGIDFLAFTGHKALMGPQGTGGLYVRQGLAVNPLKRGGTGSRSEDYKQPTFLPDALESGTLNTVGIAGLGAAVSFILDQGIDRIRRHKQRLTQALIDGLYDLQAVTLYGPLDASRQVATVSVTFDSTLSDVSEGFSGCGSVNLEWFDDGMPVDAAGKQLSGTHEIFVRAGLHCAPLAHRTLGTFPDGTVRLSLGYFNTPEQIDIAVRAIRQICR